MNAQVSNAANTGAASTKDWRAATKDMKISAYLPGEVSRTEHDDVDAIRTPAPEVLEQQDSDSSQSGAGNS